MTNGSAIWTILGGIIGCLFLCAAALFAQARRREESYDERQQIIRGRAMTLAVFAGVAYTLIMVGWDLFAGPVPIETHLILGFGMVLQLTVMHTYCALGGASIAPREKPVAVSIMYLIIGMMQLLSFAQMVQYRPLALEGDGARTWWGLLVGASLAYIGILNLVCHLWRSRE